MTRLSARDDETYQLLGKWVGMLAFRGHFATKSRRYSTTLGRLRSARRAWHRKLALKRANRFGVDDDGVTDDLEDETTLVIGQWSFVGMGWLSQGDAALAAEAAASAREWDDARRPEEQTTPRTER